MASSVSIIVPAHNAAATIEACLDAALACRHRDFEVVVVDDASDDATAALASGFPCRLIHLANQYGAARARNVGAHHAHGDVLFFTDADCLPEPDVLTRACAALETAGTNSAVGGTYAPRAADPTFFSQFQAVFVNYSETRRPGAPDYLATHALAIPAHTFHASGGFADIGLPIIEDVEFSHRLRRQGVRLALDPALRVRHIFNFSLQRSMRNALRKAMYWTMYSLRNRDLCADSGTASHELKINVVAYFLALTLLALYALSGQAAALSGIAAVVAFNLWFNRRQLAAFCETGATRFTAAAWLYYLGLYPMAVGLGALAGMTRYFLESGKRRGKPCIGHFPT
ncbi:MAG: glycosyltransferase [Pseudomonadota bacterium]|nr:MAG: glycosyltransferase [Pseudomonadota bacterium]